VTTAAIAIIAQQCQHSCPRQLVIGLGPLAVDHWVLRLWALLLIPIALSVVVASDWIRMLWPTRRSF
jgi:hypothetical protein